VSARILLVEDERLIGTMVRINLERAGYEVEWHEDGQEALDAVRGGTHDLMILDIMLPGLGGLELLSEARDAGLGTPVLILTAHAEVELKVRGLERGADDYLTKPFDVAELLARVRALLRRAPETLPGR
jgi:DNA-binding response OmpR family regulator